jgi:hypothetical protein
MAILLVTKRDICMAILLVTKRDICMAIFAGDEA